MLLEMTELEKEKLHLEKEKLRHEIKQLKRPVIFRSQFIITLIAVASLFAQGTVSHIKSERAELRIEEANKKLANIQLIRDSTLIELNNLKTEINTLEAAKQNQTEKSKRLISIVSESSKGNLNSSVKSAVLSVENSFLSIELYGFNVALTSFDLAKNTLTHDGYSLTNAQLLTGHRREWLARTPTVLYYDDRSLNTAKAIAEKLTQKTKIIFTTARGAGLGVVKGEEQISFRIHLVGNVY